MEIKNQIIWIIGASSGIGRALAESLGEDNKLILSARDQVSLESLNTSMNNKHSVFSLDVSDIQQVDNTIDKIFETHKKIDMILFMAAVYREEDTKPYDVNFAKKIVDVNLTGAISITYNLVPRLLKIHNEAQIILCASVAGYIGLPKGQPYSCTKAALINFAESMHAELHNTNVNIRLINPGFVKTRLTDKNKFTMPFIIPVDEAAAAIIKELGSKKFEIHFPKVFTYILKVIRILPYWIKLKLIKLLYRK